MQFKDVVYALGDFFLWTFEFLAAAGNAPNIFFSIVIAVLFVYWMGQMALHSKRGEN